MLRVGLTGGLGAGKSTVARMLGERGAVVLSSDAIGRELMEPGQAVCQAIVALFGPGVVGNEGRLNRGELARLAFEQGSVEELNGIVHPAVIARQEELMRVLPSDSIVVVESALLFETQHGGPGGWRERFDKVVLVRAPEAVKVARFVARAGGTEATQAGLEAEARRRLAAQMPDAAKVGLCNFVVENEGGLEELEGQVDSIWRQLVDGSANADSPRE